MKHNIKTTNIFLTPAITDYVDKRLSHLDKFISPEDLETVMCYVDIGKTTKHHKSGDFFKAELTLHIGGKSLRATSERDDLYAAIDVVNDEMANELKSFKDRRMSIIKRGRAKLKAILKGFYGDRQ
ncbi:MAG: ribosome-associated translation inhibitor RaiA [Candidatus Paceibacterota bacterium]|jgi:putative sigma-54 modulation protein